jgi:hypothetical protein
MLSWIGVASSIEAKGSLDTTASNGAIISA